MPTFSTHAPTTSKPTVSPVGGGTATSSSPPDSSSDLSLSLILGLTEGEESGVFTSRRSDLHKTANDVGDNQKTSVGNTAMLNSSGNDLDSGRISTGVLRKSIRETTKPVTRESDYDRMIRQGFNVVDDDEDDDIEEGGSRNSISRSSLSPRYGRRGYGKGHIKNSRDSRDERTTDSGRNSSPFRDGNDSDRGTRERMSESVFARPMTEDKLSSVTLTHRRSFSPSERTNIGEKNGLRNSKGRFITSLNGGDQYSGPIDSIQRNPLGPINNSRENLGSISSSTDILGHRDEFSSFPSNISQRLTSSDSSRFSLGPPESNWSRGDQRNISPVYATENTTSNAARGKLGLI